MNSGRFVAKSVVHSLIDWSGRPRRQRERLCGKLIILTYHSFCSEWPTGLFSSLPVDRFEKQLRFLKNNFKLVSLQQGLENIQQGLVDDQPWLAITIDDGFRDNYTHAWPVLKRYNIPATIFLATDFIDTGRSPWPTQIIEILERTDMQVMEVPYRVSLQNITERSAAAQQLKKAWSPLPPMERFKKLTELRRHLRVDDEIYHKGLTWDQVCEMHESGISFGAHTEYHSILPMVTSDVVESELRVARQRVQYELDGSCEVMAYPDGKHSPQVIDLVRTAGYKIALTQDLGSNENAIVPLSLNRIEVPFHDPLVTFRGRVSLAF